MNKPFSKTLLYVLICLPLLTSATELAGNKLWVREGPPSAAVLAAYGVLTNPGNTPLRLIRVESSVFAQVEFHQTTTVYGMSRMRAIESVEIPPGESLTLEPGAMHLMLMKPGTSIRAGAKVELVFTTDLNQTISVIADVVKGDPAANQHH